MTDTFDVTIEKLVFGGEGMGRLPDGRAVFVPFVLSGEVVRLRLVEEKPHFARALPTEILEPSSERIEPRCPHFGKCGGCHYQHMPYEKQLEVKLAVLKDQLVRIGGIQNSPVTGITPSGATWNYRNHVQFHVCEDGRLGYKDITGSEVLPIRECHLPQAEINTTWSQIELEPGSGIQRLSLRQDSFDEVMLLLEGTEELAPEMSLDLPVSACYLAQNGSTVTLAGDDALTFQVKDKVLRVSPESFFQVNTAQTEKMVDFVCAHLPQNRQLEILELYSGVGLFSSFLAPHASHLTAVESALSSCYDFAINMDSFNNVSLYEGAVEQVLSALIGQLEQPDLVLLDPPRAGLHPKAREALLKLGSPQIIYISCDPSTLARDLKSLCAAGYKLVDVHAFDMFPQTYHVECVVLMSRV